jgi:hypothetical protein
VLGFISNYKSQIAPEFILFCVWIRTQIKTVLGPVKIHVYRHRFLLRPTEAGLPLEVVTNFSFPLVVDRLLKKSENPKDISRSTSKQSSEKTNSVPAGGNGKPQKHPAVVNSGLASMPDNDLDFIQRLIMMGKC